MDEAKATFVESYNTSLDAQHGLHLLRAKAEADEDHDPVLSIDVARQQKLVNDLRVSMQQCITQVNQSVELVRKQWMNTCYVQKSKFKSLDDKHPEVDGVRFSSCHRCNLATESRPH